MVLNFLKERDLHEIEGKLQEAAKAFSHVFKSVSSTAQGRANLPDLIILIIGLGKVGLS